MMGKDYPAYIFMMIVIAIQLNIFHYFLSH